MNWEEFGSSDFARLNAQFQHPEMTEAEWLASSRPASMLACLSAGTSGRKLRLFACSSVRQVWHLVTQSRASRAVEVAESFVDGLATQAELAAAHQAAFAAYVADFGAIDFSAAEDWDARHYEAFACGTAADVAAPDPPARLSIMAAAGLNEAYWNAHMLAQIAAADPQFDARQATALRDLFGNPFRPPAVAERWHTPDVQSLSARIYAGRAFDRMADLGKLLAQAGCDDPVILEHCQREQHVRGCWLIDLLAGRR